MKLECSFSTEASLTLITHTPAVPKPPVLIGRDKPIGHSEVRKRTVGIRKKRTRNEEEYRTSRTSGFSLDPQEEYKRVLIRVMIIATLRFLCILSVASLVLGEKLRGGDVALRAGEKSDNHDYAIGTPPTYVDSKWVANALQVAGLQLRSNGTDILEMEPGGKGIPGGEDKFVNKFKSDLKQMGKLNELKSRAAALDPAMPWMVLALYHRGMLGSGHSDWAKMMNESTAIPANIQERFAQLQIEGMRPSSRVIDAGCGWGRFARLLIPFVDKGNYFGLELDRFELRAFIQLELGIEGRSLEERAPTMIQSGLFEFKKLLANGRQQPNIPADFVIFSSVLKVNMPMRLRLLALCNAAGSLGQGGKVVIFNDCESHKHTGSIAKVVTGFQPLSNMVNNSCFLVRDSTPAPSCERFDGNNVAKEISAVYALGPHHHPKTISESSKFQVKPVGTAKAPNERARIEVGTPVPKPNQGHSTLLRPKPSKSRR